MGEVELTKALLHCLTYYRDNERNPDRRGYPSRTLEARDRGWIEPGPRGWYVLTPTGRALLKENGDG